MVLIFFSICKGSLKVLYRVCKGSLKGRLKMPGGYPETSQSPFRTNGEGITCDVLQIAICPTAGRTVCLKLRDLLNEMVWDQNEA